MPLRDIYSVEVDDANFNEFMRTYDRYRSSLAEMPEAWRKVNEQVDGTRKSFEKLVEMYVSRNALDELHKKAQEEAKRLTEEQLTIWQRIGGVVQGVGRHTHSVVTDLTRGVREFAQWAGIAGAATGLLGFGSVYGLEHIGAWSGNLRRSSMGLGFAPGNAATMQAFQTNLGRLVDPGQFLGGINTALNDAGQRWMLYGAGLNERDLQGDTGEVALKVLQHDWQRIHNAPQGQLAQVMQAYGLDQRYSLQDAVRLRQTPYSELQTLIAQTNEDRIKNRLGDQALKDWQDFDNALKRAGNTLWDVLVTDLSKLAPQLTAISGGFTKVVDAFLQAPWLKQWINDAAGGLENFAKYIGTDQFQKDVNRFVDRVGDLAKSLGDAVKAVYDFTGGIEHAWERIPGHESYSPPVAAGPGWYPFSWTNPGSWLPGNHLPGTGPGSSPGDWYRAWHGGGGRQMGGSSHGEGMPAIAAELAKSGLPPEAQAYLYAVAGGETGGYKNPFATLAGGGSFDPSKGFPMGDWSGYPHDGVVSYGAGAWQDERTPQKWMEAHGYHFDAQGQIKGNWAWASYVYAQHSGGRNLGDDLHSGNLSLSGTHALGGQWARGARAINSADYKAYMTSTAPKPSVAPDAPNAMPWNRSFKTLNSITPHMNIKVENSTGGSASVSAALTATP